MDRLDEGRSLWRAVSFRALQVFLASLIVELATPEFLAFRVGFWQDVALAAITAAISQALALAAYRRNGTPPAPGCSEQAAPQLPGVTRPDDPPSPENRSKSRDT